MLNEAVAYKSYETIGGEKFMAPSANAYHNNVMGGIYTLMSMYVRQNKLGYVFTDSVDVYLPDGNIFKPDMVVIKKENAAIINWQGGIHGVPDMVVEVLSRSTRKKDLTVKKDAYESNGVKEYWIVDPYMKTVDVYLLKDGKYNLDGAYTKFTEYDWEGLSEEEKSAAKFEIKVAIFDDLFIKLDDIFSWGFDD